jgi:hypothetical protein
VLKRYVGVEEKVPYRFINTEMAMIRKKVREVVEQQKVCLVLNVNIKETLSQETCSSGM